MKKSYFFLFLIVVGILVSLLMVPLFEEEQDLKLQSNLAKEQIYKLKMAHNMPQESVMHQASVLFAQQVAQNTDNRVQIEIFANQTLGNDYQMIEMTRLGEIDILLTPSAKMSISEPSMQFIDLPFFFPSREDLYALLDGEVGDMLLGRLSHIGLLGVTIWENGFKHFTANEPLLEPQDFVDKKMRVMKSRIIMDQFRALGSQSLAIDFHETKKALEDGVVDGQENPLTAIVAMDIHKAQTHLTLSEHAYMGYIFSISSKTYEKLPPNLGKILINTALEITPQQRAQTQEKEQFLLDRIKESGVEVHTLAEKQKEHFYRLMEYIPKKYEETIGSDILSKTQEILFHRYKSEEDLYILGIDVDLSMDAKSSGLAIKRGVELAVEEINKKGGILGKELVVITKDNAALSSRGVKNVEDLLKYKNLIGIVGGLHSAVVLEQMEYMQHSGVSLFIPWAAASSITDTKKYKCTFRISANDMYASDFIATSAYERFKAPAIFYENSVWGRDNYSNMKRFFEQKGLRFAYAKEFNRGQESFSQEIVDSMKAGADSLIIIANSFEGGVIVTDMAGQKNPLAIISHWGITGNDFFAQNHKSLSRVDLTFFQTFSFEHNKNSVSKQLAQSYIQNYDKKDPSKIIAASGVAHAYDLVNILALGIEQAQEDARDAICREVQNIAWYEGAVKNYRYPFSAQKHDALEVSDFYMARFSSEGRIVEVGDE